MPDLQVRVRVADRRLDVAFGVGSGEVLAVMGPNGAGKSTTAEVVAGLLRPDEGLVRVGDRVVTDTARRIHVAPCDRRIGLLQQKPLLFPHLDVLANVTFAARRTAARAGARVAGLDWLSRVGASDLAPRRPGQLSGGQAQRVAVARALAAQPDVLVLDEPLAGLDVGGAAELRAVLRAVLADEGRAAILITHDLLDILALADRVLVLDEGCVAEEAPLAAVLTTPRSGFAAEIAGVNLVRGVMAGPDSLRSDSGQLWFGCSDPALSAGEPAVALFRPSTVAVYRDRPHGSPRNCVEASIHVLEATGSAVRIRARPHNDGAQGLAADVTPEAVAELGLTAGQAVWLAVKAREVTFHPGSRGRHTRHD